MLKYSRDIKAETKRLDKKSNAKKRQRKNWCKGSLLWIFCNAMELIGEADQRCTVALSCNHYTIMKHCLLIIGELPFAKCAMYAAPLRALLVVMLYVSNLLNHN
jgi:hypothetical protein